MVHLAVLYCAQRTEECSRISIELGNHLVASRSEFMEMLSNSRDSIARSMNLLSDIHQRNAE